MKKILITGIIITLILPMILSNSFATVIELESSDIKVNESKDKTIESSINIDNKDIEELNKESELNEETEKNENEIEISNYNTKNIEEDVPLVIENELNSLEILTVDEELVNSQKIIENGTYQIVSALNNNKVVDVEGPYSYSGANVHIFQNYNKTNQKFKINYIEQGYYTIEAVHSGKVLDVAGAGTINGTNVQQWESNNTDAQKWIIKEAGDGYYYIISRCNDLYLDVASADTRDGNNIHVFQGNGTLAQKFKFKETEVERLYNGIDVSEFNGDINWSLVQQTQDFAIIRVGYRGYLRPRIVMDEKFIQNIKGAQSVGLSCGIYFFSQAITEAEAIEEANWVADTISVYSIKYPVVLDSEWSNGSHNGRADYLTKQERTKVAKAFLDTIKNRGYMPMLYANPDWLYNYIDASQFSSYDLLLAHYTGSIDIPSYYSGTYTMWQYTSEGNVNGVNGNVDRNVCYKQY